MRMLHEDLLAKVAGERERIVTRRGLMTGSAKIAAGGTLALALGGGALKLRSAAAQGDERDEAFESDIDVLNYALTLEHLEFSFYRDGIDQFTFGNDPFGQSIDTNLAAIRDHEGAHVDVLTQVITDLGGEPVEEAEYDFGYTSLEEFLQVAAVIEGVGVAAYTGAAQFLIEEDALLTAALTIHGNEARHAAYLNLVAGAGSPFPAAFETPMTPDEVLEAATPFFVTE